MGKRINRIIFTYLNTIPIPRGCHQSPERSFSYNGEQYPVCARCTGIAVGQFFGILIAVIYVLLHERDYNSFCAVAIAAISSVPMGLDWIAQEYFNLSSTNTRRFGTGSLCGIGFGHLYLFALYSLINFLIESVAL